MKEKALWASEVEEYGLAHVILSRVVFHGTLSVEDISERTGYSQQTINKHARRWVEKGFLVENRFMEILKWQATPKGVSHIGNEQ